MKKRLEAVLPQTQCQQCGYQGCAPYAEAMLKGESTDLCRPGGLLVAHKLASLLGRTTDEAFVQDREQPRQMARIDLERCIGCAKCLPACPVDAILGARKWLHRIIETECNGCGLCVPACPVDCIALVASEEALKPSSHYHSRFAEKHKRQREQHDLQSRRHKRYKLMQGQRQSTLAARRAQIQAWLDDEQD